ncbi:MAG: TonB-dependent receptor [Candidatus Obscuribacterales bacterium]|nr:TonB-dependent receptor [Steroidobacteraceae bacterium]
MRDSQRERRSLSLAMAVSLTLWSAHSNAQSRPTSTTSLTEVVVTGSYIKGTAEDAAMPVEVISFEELQDMGRPSNLDLVKTMTEVGQVAGETDRYNAFPVGAATVNLRNLGSRFTTVIFNGRRFPEQFSPATGRFNNIAWIPNAAVGQVEVLKGGGAVTYGADAVGGVVNYITRKNVDGLELNADYRHIADSDGDYNADALWGKKMDAGNVMLSASYQHRSSLAAWDRDWARRHYLENNDTQTWNPANNPGAFLFQTRTTANGTPSPTTYTAISRSSAVSGVNTYSGSRQMGAIGTVRDPACVALGGYAGWGAAPLTNTLCYMQQTQFEKLVEESDSFHLYGELNIDLTDSIRYKAEAMYYQIKLPDIAMHPSEGPLSHPIEGTSRQAVSGLGAYYVPAENPAVGQFLSTFTNGYSQAQMDAINGTTPGFQPGRAALLQGSWRPFAVGGFPLYGAYDVQENFSRVLRTTQGLVVDLPEFWGSTLSLDLAGSYSHVVDRKEAADMLVDRLQQALNGLGGPNCTGTTPGAGGCLYFNPFSSGVAGNFYTGAPNTGFINTGTYTGYVPGQGLQNDIDLIRWLYVPIWLQRVYTLSVLDAVVSGETGIDLPGGPLSIAFGTQARYGTETMTLDDFSNRGINPCPSLGVTNCGTAARTGVLAFARAGTVLGAAAESYQRSDRRFPVYAVFTEAKLPVLDTLEFGLAARWEKFISDKTDNDNQVFAPAGSVRWQPFEPIAFRASYGKTFTQVNPPRDDGPNLANAATNATYGITAGQFQTADYDNVSVKPMKGNYFDVGLVISAGGFRGTVDYFDIRIDDFARTMTQGNVLQALVMPGQIGSAALLNCSSALLLNPQSGLGGRPFVELANNIPCVQGTSTLANALVGTGLPAPVTPGRINFYGGNGQTNSGQLQTSGIDLTASYTLDVFGGQLRPSLDASYIATWKLGDFIIEGVPVLSGYNGVGFKNNTTTGRIGQGVPEWRATFGVNYRRDIHGLNITARYIPSIIDEDEAQYASASNATNANIGDANGTVVCGSGPLSSPPVPDGAGTGQFGLFCANQNTAIRTGRKIKASFNVDLTYRIELAAETTFGVTISNLLDQDPSFARESISYDAGFGSPLGRTFKVQLGKKF